MDRSPLSCFACLEGRGEFKCEQLVARAGHECHDPWRFLICPRKPLRCSKGLPPEAVVWHSPKSLDSCHSAVGRCRSNSWGLSRLDAYGVNSIVETLDVIEDFRLSLSPCAVNPHLDTFALEVAEARLGNRVIPAVTTTTHAWTQSFVFSPTVELIAAKLTSMIRMDDHRIFGSPAPSKHRQRIQLQARLRA